METADIVAAVEDVGAAILEEIGRPIDTMRLEKLAYFAQVVYLAWYGKPLFEEDVSAFRDGPVVYKLFKLHQGRYRIGRLPEGDSSRVAPAGRCAIAFVCGMYGSTPGEELGKLTHDEGPWRSVRQTAGLRDGQFGYPVIPKELLMEYGRSKGEFTDQAWYWTPEWQAGEKAAKAELERGAGKVYGSDDEFTSVL